MVGHRAYTQNSLKVQKGRNLEQKMAAAMERHRVEGQKPEGTRRLTTSAIASLYQVPASSLGHRIRGRRPTGVWGRTKRWLTEAEETVLVNHIKLLGHRAIPCTPRGVRERANAILEARRGPRFAVGVNWVTRFVASHPELGVYRGTKLNKARRNGLNRTSLWDFENAVGKVFEEEKPEASQIFGMDETGLMLGTGPPQVVIGESGQRHQHQAEDGDRELVTSIVTICADGTKLNEMIIFCGKNVMSRWAEDNPGCHKGCH